MNAWHDVELDFKENQLSCIIEIPMGSKIKYELDKKSGLLIVDRILYSSVHYPCNYGFFPQTYCDDGDPLDTLVIGQLPIFPLSIMRVRPIGVIPMIDGGKVDDKIISIHIDDPEFNHITNIGQVAEHRIKEISNFFEHYKELEKKDVQIRPIQNEIEAKRIINESIKLYQEVKID